MNDIYQSAMLRMRHNFAKKQASKISQEEQKYTKIIKPAWWSKRCPANVNFVDYQRLLDEGEIVWGCLVMANNVLFDATSTEDCPAMVAYSKSTENDHLAPFVNQCAHEVYEFPNKTKSSILASEREFHATVSDQGFLGTERQIPNSISKGHDICINTLMVFRKHLPGAAIDFRYFPLLVHPFSTAVAMLPGYYWDSRIMSND